MFDALCKNCTHAIYDEQWGEWKCKKRAIRIHDIRTASYCKDYIKKKKENKKI